MFVCVCVVCVCIHLTLWVDTHVCVSSLEEGAWSSGAGVSEGCETPFVGAGHQTQIFRKHNGRSCLLSIFPVPGLGILYGC